MRLVAIIVRKRIGGRRIVIVVRAVLMVTVAVWTASRRLDVLVMGAAADVQVHEHGQQTDDGYDNAPHFHINGNYTSSHLQQSLPALGNLSIAILWLEGR